MGNALVLLAGKQHGGVPINVTANAVLGEVMLAGDVTLGFGVANLGLNPGAEAPAIDLPGFDGKPVRLADQKGKYVLLHFWSSNEKKTHEQLAHIRAAAKDWANEPRLMIIGINLDEHFSAAMKFADEQQLTWTNAYAGVNSKLLSDYVTGAGNSVFIDPDGKVVDPTLMNLEIDDLLDKTLRPQPK
jgi:peroxiredoxin